MSVSIRELREAMDNRRNAQQVIKKLTEKVKDLETREVLRAMMLWMIETQMVEMKLLIATLEVLETEDTRLEEKMKPLLELLEGNPLDIR